MTIFYGSNDYILTLNAACSAGPKHVSTFGVFSNIVGSESRRVSTTCIEGMRVQKQKQFRHASAHIRINSYTQHLARLRQVDEQVVWDREEEFLEGGDNLVGWDPTDI
jgi:hypothetical protein